MKRIAYSELSANLAHYLDKVSEERVPLLVARDKSHAVVILDEHEYEGMLETLHLFSSPVNAERLLKSVEDAKAGHLFEHGLLED